MFQLARQHAGNYLHVAMRMHAKSLARRDAIFVDHPQGAKAHMGRVVIIAESKRVISVKPTVIEMSAFRCFSNGFHLESPCSRFDAGPAGLDSIQPASSHKLQTSLAQRIAVIQHALKDCLM